MPKAKLKAYYYCWIVTDPDNNCKRFSQCLANNGDCVLSDKEKLQADKKWKKIVRGMKNGS